MLLNRVEENLKHVRKVVFYVNGNVRFRGAINNN